MKYFKLMRIKHYIKSLLVLFPIFFAGKILDLNYVYTAIIGFISFSLVSSIVYIINDIKDIEKDKLHEIKKNRPLASGSISISNAITLIILLLLIIIILNIIFIKNYSYIYLIIYLIINIGYSFGLKDKPIIDIIILSFGFLLRVLYGGLLLDIEISNWLYLTILSGSLYLSMGKRRNELIKNGDKSRKVLQYYNMDFLNKNMYMFLSLSLVFFSLWVLGMNNEYLIWIIPLVYMIFLKYSLDIENNTSYGDPIEVVLNDKVLIILGGLLGLSLVILLYVVK